MGDVQLFIAELKSISLLSQSKRLKSDRLTDQCFYRFQRRPPGTFKATSRWLFFLLQALQHLRRSDVRKTAGMAKRTVTCEARGAVQRRLIERVVFQPKHGSPGIERRRVQWAGRSKQGHLWQTKGGGHMHQAGIVADHGTGTGDHRERLIEAGAPGQVDTRGPALRADLRSNPGTNVRILGGTQQHHRR